MERSMSTYYTPELEEFRIGFQYEWLNEDKEWVKVDSPEVITPDGYDEQFYGLRVKHLDREDIEGEGWEFTGRSLDIWFKIPCNETPGGRNKLTHLTMHYNLEDHEMKITAFLGDTDEGCLFEGFILNLSEFRKLMKQLNIKKP